VLRGSGILGNTYGTQQQSFSRAVLGTFVVLPSKKMLSRNVELYPSLRQVFQNIMMSFRFFFSILEQQERILGQDCALIHHVSRFVAQFQMAQSTDPQRTAVLLLLVQ
jgi:hypothetical protein